MEPVIHNVKNLPVREGDGVRRVRLIGLEDQPPTCTMGYTEIEPGKTGSHHIHPWEHERYILSGSGVLVCDGKEYPIKEGDAIFIPGDVEHYALNNGGQGVYRHIEINPLIAAQSGGARNTSGEGTGQPPVIRNYRDLRSGTGSRILSTNDGVPNYVMLYNGAMAPGAVSHAGTGGHTHPWEHLIFVLEGHANLVCDGKTYQISEGDAVLVPPNALHQWRNTTQKPMKRVTFNPIAAEAHKG
jgi:quercetin dioxygenase-like cupin family protein